MKTVITSLFILISSLCFSQIDTQKLCGKWELIHICNDQEKALETIDIKDFIIETNKDSSFSLNAKEVKIMGQWSMDENTLVLTGKREDNGEEETNKMPIHSLTEEFLYLEVGEGVYSACPKTLQN